MKYVPIVIILLCISCKQKGLKIPSVTDSHIKPCDTIRINVDDTFHYTNCDSLGIFYTVRKHYWEHLVDTIDLRNAMSMSLNGNGTLIVDGRIYTNWNNKETIRQINRSVDSVYKMTHNGYYNSRNPSQTLQQFIDEIDSVEKAGGGIVK